MIPEVINCDDENLEVINSYRLYVREDPCIQIESSKINGKIQVSLEPYFFHSPSSAFQTWTFKLWEEDNFSTFSNLFIKQLYRINYTQFEAEIFLMKKNDEYEEGLEMNENTTFKEICNLSKTCKVEVRVRIKHDSIYDSFDYELDIDNEKLQLGDLAFNSTSPDKYKYCLAYYSWSHERYPFALVPLAKMALIYSNMALPSSTFHIVTRYEKHRMSLLEDKRKIEDSASADEIITKALGAVYHKLARSYWHRFCIDPTMSVPPQLKLENSPFLSSDEIHREIVSYEEIQEEIRRKQMKLILALNRKVVLSLTKLKFNKSNLEEDLKYSVLLDSSINFFLVTGRSPPCCSLCRKFTKKNEESSILPLEMFIPEHTQKHLKKNFFCRECTDRVQKIELDFFENIWNPYYSSDLEEIEDTNGIVLLFAASTMYKFMMSLMSQKCEEFGSEWRMRASLRELLNMGQNENLKNETTQFCPTFYCFLGEKNSGDEGFHVSTPKYYHSTPCLHVACRHFHFLMLLKEDPSGKWEGLTKLKMGCKAVFRPMNINDTSEAFREYYKKLVGNTKNNQ